MGDFSCILRLREKRERWRRGDKEYLVLDRGDKKRYIEVYVRKVFEFKDKEKKRERKNFLSRMNFYLKRKWI